MAHDQINQIQKRKKNVLLKVNNLNSTPCLWHDDFMLVGFFGGTFFLECHKIRIFQSLLILSPHFPTQVCTLSMERHVLNAWKRLNYNHWLKSNPSCNPNKWKLNISKWTNFGETSVFHYRIAGNNGVDILCVTSYFLLDLPRLEDSFSFLRRGWGEGLGGGEKNML